MNSLTIITINYNNRDGLERTMNSVFSQTYEDFEYIIIDGGSTDGSKELLESNTQKISCWISEPDKGIYNAMNKGIKVAKGEYLLFLNSGDILYSADVIEKVILELDQADIISGSLIVSDPEKGDFCWNSAKYVTFDLLFDHTLGHPNTFIKRKCFETVGEYDENLKIVSDWKWFLLGLVNYNLSYKSIDLVISVFYNDGISSESSNEDLITKERDVTLKKYFPLFYDDYIRLNELDAFKEDLDRSRLFKVFLKVKSFFALFKK
ncbi:glycosyltransferase family 2 protein [Sphingobacterium rhinopitheci]|uniref:glycosyltransferase family 2 protein n=1 Tax=Sphingobacterium rhinopitheci TaxID=2781960 RepID=UPI001F52A76E|nr:glycosyltransferase family 2 protein [Sphingobacterium rhinopitheci]MCI0920764.1 glycosyltransferase [Sphingobacterium rhinopitheci]